MSWQVPGYVHRRELGNGTTGRVVLAVHEASGDLVVIKYLKVNGDEIERVREDVALLSTLDIAYFGRIREYVEESDARRAAIVMDAINGVTLRLLLREFGAFSPEASLFVFRESLRAMAGAWEIGVVHGDYRPENVLIDVDGGVYILDAGAVAWINRAITLGTGVYLAPERWRGEAMSMSADLYAITVTFVEMLVGEPPFWEASQLLSLRYMHEQDEFLLDAIPHQFHESIRRGLAKDARERADAVAILELVEAAAVAEYGAEWESVARRHVHERAAQAASPFGGDAIEAVEVDSTTELDEFDDYYSDASAAAAVEGARVVAAAEDIATVARIQEATSAAAYASAEEDVLTAEEEAAVAEVEMIVGATAVEVDEADAEILDTDAVEGADVVDGGDVAAASGVGAEEAEIVATEVVGVDEVVAGAAAAGAVAGAAAVEIAEASATEIVGVEEAESIGAAAGAAAGVAAVEAAAAGVSAADVSATDVSTTRAAGDVESTEILTIEETSTAAAVGAIAGAAVAGAAVAGAAAGAVGAGAVGVGAVGAGAVGAGAVGAGAVGAGAAAGGVAGEAAEVTGAGAEVAAGEVAAGEVAAGVGAAGLEAASAEAAAAEAAAGRAVAGGAVAGGAVAGGAAAGGAAAGGPGAKAVSPVPAGAGAAAAGSEAATTVIPRIPAEATTQFPRIPAAPEGELVGAGAAGISAGENRAFVRRHPWLTVALGLILVLICGGAALALTGKPAGGPEKPVANGSTQAAVIGGPSSNGNVIPVTSSSSPGVGSSSSGPAVSPSASGSATGPVVAPSASGTPSASPTPGPKPSSTPSHATKTPTPAPAPTLPKTGIHPIRQMLVVAWMLVTFGALLMFVFRRRREDEVR